MTNATMRQVPDAVSGQKFVPFPDTADLFAIEDKRAFDGALFRYLAIHDLLTLSRGTTMAQLREELSKAVFQAPSGCSTRIPDATLESWYYRFKDHGFAGLLTGKRSDAGTCRTLTADQENQLDEILRNNPECSGREVIRLLKSRFGCELQASESTLYREIKQRRPAARQAVLIPKDQVATTPEGAFAWMHRLMQGKMEANDLGIQPTSRLTDADVSALLRKIHQGGLPARNRAVAFLAHFRGISNQHIADFLCYSRPDAVSGLVSRFLDEGMAVFDHKPRRSEPRPKTFDLKDKVLRVLHTPPSHYGINRKTWTYELISEVMEREGKDVSRSSIGRIVKDAGYKFRKAKKTLTSTDPNYREKLREITAILSHLQPDERFFSVDEFGPFAVKKRGGRALVAPGEERSVPQYQSSKGTLLITAALELSTNQITHFYSDKKNTAEMINLLYVLIDQYCDQARLYFSWDSASWHGSKRFHREVAEVNSAQYRDLHGTPEVVLAPLPASSQFLNVIESVFSGMARAILHNSDYPAVAECKAAIDDYLAERNRYFKEHPKRAGNKIWGRERLPPVFNEANCCKDPRFR